MSRLHQPMLDFSLHLPLHHVAAPSTQMHAHIKSTTPHQKPCATCVSCGSRSTPSSASGWHWPSTCRSSGGERTAGSSWFERACKIAAAAFGACGCHECTQQPVLTYSCLRCSDVLQRNRCQLTYRTQDGWFPSPLLTIHTRNAARTMRLVHGSSSKALDPQGHFIPEVAGPQPRSLPPQPGNGGTRTLPATQASKQAGALHIHNTSKPAPRTRNPTAALNTAPRSLRSCG